MSLKGKIGYKEISEILSALEQGRKSGILAFTSGAGSARLFLEWGELIRAESSRFKDRIGELLVQRGILDSSEVGRALDLQRAEGGARKLGEILCQECSVSERDIQYALADQFKAILADVLSWPGGTFEFSAELPSPSAEKFKITASEFIIEVGIETGLHLGNAEASSKTHSILFLEPDTSFAQEMLLYLARYGVRAECASGLEDALTALEGGDFALLAVNTSQMNSLGSILAAAPGVGVAFYGPASDAPRQSAGCGTYLVKPENPGVETAGLASFRDALLGALKAAATSGK